LTAAAMLGVAAALFLWIAQPDPSPVDLGALIAVAGLLATVLSLGLTVTLLVAQHMAERHARALYSEFRKEKAWGWGLALLAGSVVAIVAAALLRPTIATAWAALSLAVALGLFAASRFSRLLDSLDRTELARRITRRIVRRLHRLSRQANGFERQKVLEPEAKHGLEIAASLLMEGLSRGDGEGVRDGVVAIRQMLLAYLREIPSDIGMSDGVVFHAFQLLGAAVDECVELSPVVLLPIALQEVRILGSEAATVPNRLNEYDPVSTPLNAMLSEVVAKTLKADKSAGAAMATDAMGESAVALVAAERPTGVTDHVRRLRQISLAGVAADRHHVTGQAMYELARIALALTESEARHIMPPHQYQDACEAMIETIDAFISRPAADGTLMRDSAMTFVTGPLARPNLSVVALAGAQADISRSRRGREFGWGAEALIHALCRLAAYDVAVVMTPVYARDSAYSAVVGAFALFAARPHDRLAEQASTWWQALWTLALSSESDKRAHDFETLAANLLLLAVDAVHSGQEPLAGEMARAIEGALDQTISSDPSNRDRVLRAWVPAAMAALGSDMEPLAARVVGSLRTEMLDLQAKLDGQLAQFGASFELSSPNFGTPMLSPRNVHRRDGVGARFEELLVRESA
jgi:hypothetical protein